MLAYFDLSLGWREILKRTVRETQADNGFGLAAQLAYYFFLALFPALLVLIALAGLLATQDSIVRAVSMLEGLVPPDVVGIVRDQLTQIASSESGGLVTFGVAAALWSSSAAMVSVIGTLNRAYDVQDSRAWWKQRLTAILLTTGAAVFILASVSLVLAGPELAQFIGERVGLGATFVWTWTILQWPIVFTLVATAVGLIYYFAPDVDQDFVWITPGSLFATLLWVVGSLGFRVYVVNFGSYNETYGLIGGVMVLMLWLYLSGLAIVLGAEMNAEIEHAAPHGKTPGEKRPGARKVIGGRGARAFRARRESAEGAPLPTPASARSRWLPAAAFARTGVLVSGIVATLLGRRIGS